MPTSVASVAAYLAGLPAERRAAIAKVRDLVRKNLPPGFEEGLQFGMISWFIPPERYGQSYNAQPLTIAALASHKSYMALYLTGLYAAPAVAKWFAAAYKAAGKKLDMGKSCVRFHRLEDLPLDVVALAAAKISVADFIASYEKEQAGRKQKPIVMPGRKPVAASKREAALTKAKAAPTKAAPTKAKAALTKTKAAPTKAKAAPTKTKAAPTKAKAAPTKAKAAPTKAASSARSKAASSSKPKPPSAKARSAAPAKQRQA